MKLSVFLLILLLVLGSDLNAQTQEATPEFIQKEISRGKQYCLLFFKTGIKSEIDSAKASAVQMEHLQNLFTMKLEGKLPLFGPVLEKNSSLKGICIFNIADKEEVKKLIEEDPYVKSGALTYEIYQWFGLPGDALP